jgi:hypothetical protein
MNISFMSEPELEFGRGGRHIDVRFGLMDHGPLDVDASPSRTIRAGVVGTAASVEAVLAWIDRCRTEIAAKPSRLPNLFPRFPGFSPDSPFASSVEVDGRLQRVLTSRDIQTLLAAGSRSDVSIAAAGRFIDECRLLTDTARPDVLICAPPDELLEGMDPPVGEDDRTAEAESAKDGKGVIHFHDVLKAHGLPLGVPIQMVRPETYDPTKRKRQRGRRWLERTTQDEATRAWNFHTALYYKAGGIPWRLLRDPKQLTACYVGISFYRTLDEDRLLTSIAQVFNERGDGMILRGAPVKTDKDDRVPHLSEADATTLLATALEAYRAEHKNLPARLVVHKTSSHSEAEVKGFLTAAETQRIESLDLMSVGRTTTRLFRAGTYPPLRGTFLSLDAGSSLLYTRGSVDFFRTYPGMYVPMPLMFRSERTDQTARFLGEEILALTKMNWNNTQFDGAEPITLRAARQVGDILKHVGPTEVPQARYAFYM